MADIRTVAELVTQGAQKFVQDYVNAQVAVTNLTNRLQESNRVRTEQLTSSVEATRAAIQKLGTDGAQGVKELNAALDQLTSKLESVSRIRTPQLAGDIKSITDALKASAAKTLGGEAGVASNLAAIQGTQVARFADTSIASKQAQALAQAQNVAAQAAAAHAATLQGRLQIALTNLGTALGRATGLFHQTTVATQQATQAAIANAGATAQQAHAQDTAHRSGITYLSVLSAVHAASFLATNRTFSLIGSFATLGLAFGKVSATAGAVGLALGGFLLIIGQINQAAQLVQQAFLGAAQALVTVSAVSAAAVVAAGAAGVKIAADVQSQFALIAAVEGATTEQLKGLETEVSRLALTFGVSAQDVTAAASLFVRAGGDIAGAIDGATEAIIKLVVASAGELKAAEAARAVATGLRAFAQEGVTAEQIANAVAAAAQRSALSFTEVSQAFQQAVPGSVTLGITLSDLTAIITTLGNSALRGTVAGTSFKQFLLDLVNPSVKAAKALAELGVNIQDSSKNIRPIFDIIADLNEALDTLSQGDRAQKIAEIFESRAGLAGAILSRTTITQLRELKAELDSLTVTNIVDVLLLPLNKQLERLGVTVSELGRKFGGPLLDPIRAAVVTAINFFQRLIPLAELAGQIVSVVLAGQGFGALQTKITDLVGNNKASSFLIELTNSFRNIADVIISQIVPAVQSVIDSFNLFGEAPEDVERVGTAFDRINATIQRVGAVTAVAIKAIGNLAIEFVNGEGRGGELRTQILNIAAAITAHLITSLATTVVFLTVATSIMIKFGEIALRVANRIGIGFDLLSQHANKLGDSFEEFGLKARKASLSAQKGIALSGGDIEGALKLTQELVDVEDQLTAQKAGPRQNTPLGNTLLQISEGALEATKFSQELLRVLNPESIDAEATRVINVFDNLAGEVPDALSNLKAQIAEIQRGLEEEAGRSTGAVPGVDPEKVKQATDKVTELARDMSRKLANLAEDTATKTSNIIEKGLERLEDIFDKARQQIIDIGKDAQEQINDIFTNIGQRRLDRARTDALKDQLDKQLEDKQRELDDEARAEERALDRTRTNRQRDTEDNSRVLDEQFSDLERVLQRSQDASERAARRVQQVREDALKATQDAEERNLSRSLDAQATARREQQQLSEAKTPEERARVQAQIQASRTEAQFSRQQEDQLSALRARHEAQQRALTEQNELQNIAFKQSQENQLLSFRKNNEKTLLIIRRNLDDQERGIREREEDTQLANRERRERQLQTLRRGHEQELRNLQDTLENEAAQRQATKIVERARERAEEIITNAVKQALEQQTAIEQQLTTQRQEIERSLRALNDQITDFEENLPADVKSAILGSINALRGALATGSGEIIRTFDEERARLLSQFNTEIGLGEIDLRSNIPNLTIPTPNVPIQVTPRQVIQASVIQAAQLIIGQAAAQQLGNTFLGALRQADQEGITLDTPVDFNPVIGAINVTNNSLNLLRGIFGR